nr:MAG TPA: S-locus glycoprotein domain [Caudoviricetes sp.]
MSKSKVWNNQKSPDCKCSRGFFVSFFKVIFRCNFAI